MRRRRTSKESYLAQRQEIRLAAKLRGLKGQALEQAAAALSPDEIKMLVNRAQRLKGKRF